MNEWDKIINEKLLTYEYNQEVSQKAVDVFFRGMDEKNSFQANLHWTSITKVAAGFVAIIGIMASIFTLSQQNTEVAIGGKESIILPDGSHIILNAKSEITYNSITWLWNRNVELKGEAFFKVKKGSNFSVSSECGITEVLGTSFNIYDRNGIFEVKCHTGKVRVSSEFHENVITSGQGVRCINNQNQELFQFETDQKNWMAGEFHFDNTNMSQVIQEFELQYDYDLESSDNELSTMKYSGFFPANNLKLALKLICEPMDLEYEIIGRKIKLTNKQ